MNKNKLSVDYYQNIKAMDTALRVDESFDLIKKNMTVSNVKIAFYYIDGFVSSAIMQKLMMHISSVKDFGDKSAGAAGKFADESLPAVEVNVTDSLDDLILAVMSGCTAMFADGFGPNAIIIDSRTYPARETSEPENERIPLVF